MTDEVIIHRCYSVIKNHPNSGTSVGHLRKWLKELIADKDRGRDLKKIAKEVHKDNTLADKVSTMLEQFSGAPGDPWKRHLGKHAEKDSRKIVRSLGLPRAAMEDRRRPNPHQQRRRNPLHSRTEI